MNYEEAKKLVGIKAKDNMITVQTSYNIYVFPFKEGMAFVEALKSAEQLDKTYNPQRVLPLARDGFEFRVMPAIDYERMKIAGLLDLTIDEVIQLEKPPKKEETNEPC